MITSSKSVFFWTEKASIGVFDVFSIINYFDVFSA